MHAELPLVHVTWQTTALETAQTALLTPKQSMGLPAKSELAASQIVSGWQFQLIVLADSLG
jgi:hypothetical protein